MRDRPSTSRSSLLAVRAHAMRRSMTEPEARLFRQILGCRLGVSFRRQVVLAGFIVDFVAFRARLVVEVDGKHHARRLRADARRDRVLERLGFRVLRLPAELVLHDIETAVDRIWAALGPP